MNTCSICATKCCTFSPSAVASYEPLSDLDGDSNSFMKLHPTKSILNFRVKTCVLINLKVSQVRVQTHTLIDRTRSAALGSFIFSKNSENERGIVPSLELRCSSMLQSKLLSELSFFSLPSTQPVYPNAPRKNQVLYSTINICKSPCVLCPYIVRKGRKHKLHQRN